MTPERIAELRRLAEAAKYFYAGAGDTNTARVVAACNAIPELLDELEAVTGQRDDLALRLLEAETECDDLRAQQNHYIREFDHASFEYESLAAQLQESEAANEAFRCELGRVAPTEYRCVKPNGWLCGLGYGHAGGCMPVNHPHPLGSD